MDDRKTHRAIPIVMDEGALSEAAAKSAAHGADHDLAGHSHAGGLGAPVPAPAPVFLHVAGHPISEAEIAREMQMHRAQSPHEARREAAQTLVIRELVRLECVRLEIEPEPENGETADEALVRQLMEREIETPTPDADAIQHYYAANRERLHHPDRVLVRHILLAAAPGDTSARLRAMQRGETLIAELRTEPDRFGEFAMRHSACPSQEHGGALGWLERSDTVPEFDRQLFMLREGLAGLTVETRYGHHVVHVDAIERGETLVLEEAAPVIAAYLETQSKQNAIHDYLLQLQERYPVEGLDQYDTTASL